MSFLECCLQIDPNRRKTIRDLLDHEFLQCSTIPWYYFKWIADEPTNLEMDTTTFSNTDKMVKDAKEAQRLFSSDILLSSMSTYYQECS